MAFTDPINEKTGDAPIMKQGHTTNGRYGTDPTIMVQGKPTTRDLSIPVTGGN